MKRLLLHLLLATAVTFLALALEPSMQGQAGDQDPAVTTPRQHPDPSAGQQPQQNDAQMPSSGDTTTQEAKTFTGRIVKENGAVILKDPIAKMSYKLDNPAKAKQYMGKEVKVTGKLDMNSNTIQIASIELLS
jgi:uncharacterized protein DUF5818